MIVVVVPEARISSSSVGHLDRRPFLGHGVASGVDTFDPRRRHGFGPQRKESRPTSWRSAPESKAETAESASTTAGVVALDVRRSRAAI